MKVIWHAYSVDGVPTTDTKGERAQLRSIERPMCTSRRDRAVQAQMFIPSHFAPCKQSHAEARAIACRWVVNAAGDHPDNSIGDMKEVTTEQILSS
jgi:hypothetical protein